MSNGSFIPNGVTPEKWYGLTEADLEHPVEGVHFRQSKLPHFLAQAGYRIHTDVVNILIASPYRWFYMLHPYAVPELDETFQNLSSNVRHEIESGKCYLLVDYAHEGYSWWMFYRIYEALSTNSLPHEQVVLVSGDLNVESTHARYVAEHGITCPIRVHPLNYFKNQVAEHLSFLEFCADHLTWLQVAEKRKRNKLFLNFNRRNRLHRIVTVYQLQRRSLLALGYVSLPEQFEGRTNEEAFEDEGARYGVSISLMQELRANYPRLRLLLPLQVDVDATSGDHTNPTWPYLESWMSLVSETLFFESVPGQVFLTEKIWKPMANFHPFLLIGDANSLATLHRLGFRTFHPYINETYDSAFDHEQRLSMVLDELQRLSLMPKESRYEWFMGMKDTLIHNYETLKANKFDETFQMWNSYIQSK